MFDSLRVDSVRLSDLSVGGWIGLGIIALGVGLIGRYLADWALAGENPLVGVVFGGVVIFVGAALAYENGAPECEGTCDHCGQYIRAHSSRDEPAEFVEVHASGAPRRASLGSLSVVIGRNVRENVYCTPGCAAEDTRVVMGAEDHAVTPAAEVDSDAV